MACTCVERDTARIVWVRRALKGRTVMEARMSLFHRTKLEQIREHRKCRRDFAEMVRNNIFREEFYATNITEIEETIRAAKREDDVYVDLLDEPLPDHMRKALEAEVLMWMTLHDLLFKAPRPEDEYPALCRQLRPYVAILIDLLHAEEEMMTSPLVRHYLRLVDAWRAEAARVKL